MKICYWKEIYEAIVLNFFSQRLYSRFSFLLAAAIKVLYASLGNLSWR